MKEKMEKETKNFLEVLKMSKTNTTINISQISAIVDHFLSVPPSIFRVRFYLFFQFLFKFFFL